MLGRQSNHLVPVIAMHADTVALSRRIVAFEMRGRACIAVASIVAIGIQAMRITRFGNEWPHAIRSVGVIVVDFSWRLGRVLALSLSSPSSWRSRHRRLKRPGLFKRHAAGGVAK